MPGAEPGTGRLESGLEMSQKELAGFRNADYSAWHRTESLRRFINPDQAKLCSMIDLDSTVWTEYDDNTKMPLAFIETAVYSGKKEKIYTVTRNCSLMTDGRVPAFVVLYEIDVDKNPADTRFHDIVSFWVKRVYPDETGWKKVLPQKWAECLLSFRNKQCVMLGALFKNQEAKITQGELWTPPESYR